MSARSLWAQALLDPSQAPPNGISTWNASDPAARLAVYRNNVMVSLVDALAQTFPISQKLVGETFFRSMAQVFVRAHPPRSPVLAHYGGDFPSFIGNFPPAAGLPYLADVALLEWVRMQSLHAADSQPLDKQSIYELMHDEAAFASSHWQLAPCLYILRSSFAVVSLWAAHHPNSGISVQDVRLENPESALVFRSALDVMVLSAHDGLTTLAASLAAEMTLASAMEAATQVDPDFEPAQGLAVLLGNELLVGVRSTH